MHGAADGQPSETRYFVVKADADIFFPTEQETREKFGETWKSLGVTINLVEHQLCPQHQLALRVEGVYAEDNDDHVYVAPLGVQYTWYLREQQRAWRPYLGASADCYLVDLKIANEDIHNTTTALGGSLFVGSTIGSRGYLQATYSGTKHIHDIDVCGLKVTAGYNF